MPMVAYGFTVSSIHHMLSFINYSLFIYYLKIPPWSFPLCVILLAWNVGYASIHIMCNIAIAGTKLLTLCGLIKNDSRCQPRIYMFGLQ